MSFDSFLNKVKYYFKIFFAGFAAGFCAFIVRTLLLSKSISIHSFFDSELYIFSITAGMTWLLTGIIDDLLQQVSFMKSFYKQMEPVYYSILGPILLAAILGVMTPITNIFLHSKIFRAAFSHMTIKGLFLTLFAGFESKYKNIFIYYTIRVTIDSIFRALYKKYLDSGNKTVRVFIFTLVAGISAGISPIAAYPIRKQFDHITWIKSIYIAITDAIVMLVMTPIATIISTEFKFIEFVCDLC